MELFGDLLARARRGEEEALGTLYDEYARRVMGAARRRLSPGLRRQFDSLDLAQSVFADVLRDIDRVADRGEEAFRHWLYIKVENKVRDKLRKHLGKDRVRWQERLRTDPGLRASGPSPATAAADREEQQDAKDRIDALEESSRALLLLRIEEGLTFEQIAGRLGLSSGEAARKRYARCLGRLRADWEA